MWQNMPYYAFTDELRAVLLAEGDNIELVHTGGIDNPTMLVADKEADRNVNGTRRDAYAHNSCMKREFAKFKMASGPLSSNDHPEFYTTLLLSDRLLPVFSQCKTTCHSDILWPGWWSFTQGEATPELPENRIWSNKHERLVFRGSTTGIPGGHEGPLELVHRPRLINWATNMSSRTDFPIQLDIGFHLIQCPYGSTKECEYMGKNYKTKPMMTFIEQFKSKYNMVIDGHGWPARFQPLLFGSSLIFLSTVYVEWLSFVIRPWRSYIPIDIDLGNLEENLLIVHRNQERAKQTVERANRVAHRFLEYQGRQCYLGILMLEYAELLVD